MASFTDLKGRRWTVALNVQKVREVRDRLDVDLVNLERSGALQQLIVDPVRVCDVLYLVCREECRERNIDDAQFGESLAGECFGDAVDALMEAICDFFPPRVGTLVKATAARVREAQDYLLDKQLDLLESLDVAQLVQQTLGNASGTSPAKSESTPSP